MLFKVFPLRTYYAWRCSRESHPVHARSEMLNQHKQNVTQICPQRWINVQTKLSSFVSDWKNAQKNDKKNIISDKINIIIPIFILFNNFFVLRRRKLKKTYRIPKAYIHSLDTLINGRQILFVWCTPWLCLSVELRSRVKFSQFSQWQLGHPFVEVYFSAELLP